MSGECSTTLFDRLAEMQGTGAGEAVAQNVYLESFLLHFRNILDFLTPRKSAKADDVKSSDFVAGYVAPAAPTRFRTPIDKRLSHVSYDRLGVLPSDKTWPASEMLQELELAWKDFMDALASQPAPPLDWFGRQPADAFDVGPPVAVDVTGVVAATTSQTVMTIVDFPPSA